MKEAFQIIFEDEYLAVLNKIAKILIQPSPKEEKITLTTLLEEKIKQKVYPCHRLDRETSGLIIYAKTKEDQAKLMEQFRSKIIKKRYYAFIKGRLMRKKGIFSSSIIDKEGKRFGEKPKKAKTFYRIIKEYTNFSVVDLAPITGRTNQLRIQLAKAGHPVLGERKYALGRDFEVKFKRLALHAYFLSFIHPLSKDRVNLKIDLAQDMREFLKRKE